jgi:lysophospholipase L1-like esterase
MRHPRATPRSLVFQWWLPLTALCLSSSCAVPPAARAPADAGEGGVPRAARTITQLVILGDSISAHLGVADGEGFDDLLLHNDDRLFPSFAGKDLATLYPAVERVNLAKAGATSAELPHQASLVTPNPSGLSLVLISAGTIDFGIDLLSVFDAHRVAKKAAEVTRAVQRVTEIFSDRKSYPYGACIGLFSLYDPTDGGGPLPAFPGSDGGFCPLFVIANVVIYWPLFNHQLADFARSQHLELLDLYQRFLGHGFRHADTKWPTYHTDDPTLWFLDDCLHPNVRGNHEIRRLIWEQMVAPLLLQEDR